MVLMINVYSSKKQVGSFKPLLATVKLQTLETPETLQTP
jgi:hypothetical protein